MLLKQIQYFIAVVDHHSFTEAAQKCYVSQSAISQQISLLEEELQCELLHRTNRRMELTKAGEHFYQEGKKLLLNVETLTKETRVIATKGKTILNIGYLRHYDGDALQKTIAIFSNKYPDVEIHIINGNHEELYERLRTDKVDLILSDQRRSFSDNYVNFQLLHCQCYIIVDSRSSLYHKDFVDIQDLQNEICIIVSSKDQRRNETLFYQELISYPNDFLFSDSIRDAKMMVMNHRGFLLLEGKGSGQVDNEMIRKIPLYKNNEKVLRNYCAFWKKDMTNFYIEEFADILRKEFRSENE